MSFTNEIQDALLELPLKKTCCRKALLLGILCAVRKQDDGWVLYAYHRGIAELAQSMLERIFHAKTELAPMIRAGRETFALSFVAPSVSAFLETLDNSADVDLPQTVGFRCAACETHFLRGVFLGAASVSDPNKGYHMEMLFASEGRADAVSGLLNDTVGRPSRTHRGNRFGVCYKSNGAIADLLYLIGCAKTNFDMTNVSIEREIRNNANRATNCETSNISRAVDAAQRHCSAIEALIASRAVDTLSEELRATAYLRLEYPDASLSELALMHEPPLTKSGLNRRLAKLVALAEEKESAISS